MSIAERQNRPSVLFGAAYYAEYHQGDRLDEDLDLMVEAGFTVIRVGESVWSTWEPTEGKFNLDWLEPVLDGAHARGIGVILGTPTYAAPPWLQVAYPEIAAETATGRRIPWGSRQEIDYTHAAFRFHAERIIRAVVGRYAKHPAVIGYQVDNEPGLHLLHNRATFARFVAGLKATYGDVETLNREWGLTYWSHRIAEWSELWTPEGNSLPQYDLAWRRFQSQQTNEFIHWQADIVREYADEAQFVTTCIAYPRPAIDDEALAGGLDVTAGNPYYPAQDHLDPSFDLEPVEGWVTSGVAGMLRQADRLFSSRQERFLVTETGAQSIGGPGFNFPPYPGQLEQAAFALISRGASMIEYWHWHTLPFGTETFWGGVLPHSLVPGRIYRESARIGERLGRIGSLLDGYEPDADVAMIWSTDSKYALDFSAPFPGVTAPPAGAYERLVDAFHAGVVDAGGQVRILHTTQALALGAQTLVERYPVLVAAGNYVATDEDLDLLAHYAELGGHLVLGPRTGYADTEARARVAVAPDRLVSASGIRYEEFSNLEQSVSVISAGDIEIPSSATATAWADGLILDDAEALVRYEHPHFGAFPAVTTRTHGAGRVTVVGTVPDRQLASALMAWAMPQRTAETLLAQTSAPVTVTSGSLPDGRRIWFVFNWGWDEVVVELRRAVTVLEDEQTLDAGSEVTLPAWGVTALLDS